MGKTYPRAKPAAMPKMEKIPKESVAKKTPMISTALKSFRKAGT